MTTFSRLTLIAIVCSAVGALAIERVQAGGSHYFPPVQDAQTAKECGACHMAYPASMLPAASWQRIMNDLGNHFGEDASLDATARQHIAAYLAANAGDQGGSRWGARMLRGVDPAQAPLRITELPRWVREHHEVSAREWTSAKVKRRANCAACHSGAEQGYFDED